MKTVILTSDGKTFSDQSEATNHENLLSCIKDYESSSENLCTAIQNLTLTADGEPFSIGWASSYYHVAIDNDGPRVETIYLSRHGLEFSMEYGTPSLHIYKSSNGSQRIHLDINSLFVSEQKAWDRVVELMEEDITYRQTKLDKAKGKRG